MHPRRQLSPEGLVRAAGLAALLVIIIQTSADADLWGHLRFGQDIIDAGGVPAVDDYSFTTDQAWINHEWLAEVGMSLAYAAGGPLGLVVLKTILAVGALLLVSIPLRQRIHGEWLRASLFVFAILAGIVPLTGTMRPQVFSLVCFSALLVVLASAKAAPRRLWWLPPLFALWVNLHGGWVVGLGVLGVWSAARILDTPQPRWQRRLVLVCVLSALATLANPYGWRLWVFVATTVGVDRDDIVEWYPLWRLPILLIPWALTTLAALWAVWRARRVDAGRLAVCVLLGVASVMVARLIGFYALAVVVLLASLVRSRSARLETRATPMPRAASAVVGAVVIVLALTMQRPALTCLQPSEAVGLAPVAMAHLRANDLSGRMLVWFNWGEYAIWHLSPALRVSIDGRRETVYSQAVIDAHTEFYRNGPTARSYLEELHPDYVWLPRRLPVSPQLVFWGWRPLFETPQSVVWIRPGLDRPTLRDALLVETCFP